MIGFDKYTYGLLAAAMKEVFTEKFFECNHRSCRVTLLPNPKTQNTALIP